MCFLLAASREKGDRDGCYYIYYLWIWGLFCTSSCLPCPQHGCCSELSPHSISREGKGCGAGLSEPGGLSLGKKRLGGPSGSGGVKNHAGVTHGSVVLLALLGLMISEAFPN